MEYMFLLYHDEQRSAQATEEERNTKFRQLWAVRQESIERGVFRAASPLESTGTALTARENGGSVVFTDGPFAETKEQLGGFYLLECRDLEEARYWAGRIAEARTATSVEFRALRAVPRTIQETAPAR